MNNPEKLGNPDFGSATKIDATKPSTADLEMIKNQTEMAKEAQETEKNNEELEAILEKARKNGYTVIEKGTKLQKKNSKEKSKIGTFLKRGAVAIAAAAILTGEAPKVATAAQAIVNKLFAPDPTQDRVEVDDQDTVTTETESVDMYGESNPYEITIGSEREKTPEAHVDGYDQPGMWLSGDKERPFNFADASEVARLFKNSEKGMAKYNGINQIEAQGSYLHFMPDVLKTEDLKNLNMTQAAKKLDELASDQSEEGKKKFAEAQKAFVEAINHADVDHPTLNGNYYSAYIGYEDEHGNILNRDQAVQLEGAEFVHDNMKLMQSVVHLDNKEVTRFTFKDEQGNVIKDKDGNPYTLIINATPIYDDNGKITGFNGCLQPYSAMKFEGVKVVNQEGDEFVPVDTENPPKTPPTPPKTPPKTPPTPPTPKRDDSKNAAAIEQNMQTHDETNNYVTPMGPGNIEARPDTSTDSYQNEQQNQWQVVEQTWEAPSESNYYETIGDAIEAADQGLAGHENYTPEQVAENNANTQAQEIQEAANEQAQEIKSEAKANEGMTDDQAADWFNNLTNGGGQ